jgi:hypothetical protein
MHFKASLINSKQEENASLNNQPVWPDVFFKKSAQFSSNIAQKGALRNKNFRPKKYMVKIYEFTDKK